MAVVRIARGVSPALHQECGHIDWLVAFGPSENGSAVAIPEVDVPVLPSALLASRLVEVGQLLAVKLPGRQTALPSEPIAQVSRTLAVPPAGRQDLPSPGSVGVAGCGRGSPPMASSRRRRGGRYHGSTGRAKRGRSREGRPSDARERRAERSRPRAAEGLPGRSGLRRGLCTLVPFPQNLLVPNRFLGTVVAS